MDIRCALCMLSDQGETHAVTMINGQALCRDHLGYFQGASTAFTKALDNVKRRLRTGQP